MTAWLRVSIQSGEGTKLSLIKPKRTTMANNRLSDVFVLSGNVYNALGVEHLNIEVELTKDP
jgi:hypothetical protein